MRVVSLESPKIYQESNQTPFLGISPLDPDGWEKSLINISARPSLDKELGRKILEYNLSIGNNDAVAINSIRKLEQEGAVCVFTGQQLGFMGGPAYTVLKGISCLSLAKLHHAVPLFWLATEDHDIGEIDHAYLQDMAGNIFKFRLNFPKDGRPVEDLEMSPENVQLVSAFLQEAGAPSLFEPVTETRQYSNMMARVLVTLFKGTGLLFIEPRILRPFSISFFKREIEEADEINQRLKETTDRLIAVGGRAQLEIHSGTNLFMKAKGGRRLQIKVHGEQFLVGAEKYSKDKLLKMIEENPENFGTNAAARPVLQSLHFKTAAYIAGPGELAYFHQLKDYHERHGISMPWIVPRISATFISETANEMLERSGLNPWDPIPKRWSEAMPELEEGCEDILEKWQRATIGLDHISRAKLSHYVQKSFEQFKRRVILSRLKAKKIPSNSLHYLNNCFYPHNTLQERVMNWFQFQGKTEMNLVYEMMNCIDIRFSGHHFCYLT